MNVASIEQQNGEQNERSAICLQTYTVATPKLFPPTKQANLKGANTIFGPPKKLGSYLSDYEKSHKMLH